MELHTRINRLIAESRKISFKVPDKAYQMANEACELAMLHGLALEEAQAKFAMGLACRSMTKLSECYDYALDAYRIFENLNDLFGMATALNLIGVVYFYNAMYERALESFLRSSRMLDEEKDHITLTRIHNNLGEVYREIGSLDEALSAYEKAMQLCLKTDSEDTLAVLLENIGEIYLRKKEYDRSHHYFNKSYEILIRNNEVDTAIAEVENKLGRIQFIRGNQELARMHYSKALKMLNQMNNHFFAIDVLINLAELEMPNREKLAIAHLTKAVEYGEELTARKKLRDIYLMLVEFYEKKNDFELALNFHKRFYRMEQEIETATMSSKLEIIRLELDKLFHGEEVETVKRINNQLTTDIEVQRALLESMEKKNRNLSMEILLDELTGIPNRRGVRSFLQDVWQASKLEPFNVVLFMLDLDFFKRYNDCHGHIVGDQCLKLVAACFTEIFSQWDGMVGRFGGEEFVGFIRDISFEEAEKAAEKIREAVEDLNLIYFSNNIEQLITVSIGGIWSRSDCFENYPDLVTLADKKLFDAKNTGRNKVCMEMLQCSSLPIEPS